MKISDVKTYIVPEDVSVTPWVNGDPWVLVQVMTDTGISGWGHAHTLYEREEAIARKVHDLAQRMDGMDPFRIKHFMMRAGEGTNGAPIGIETAAAAAGIEIALWDIVGKALDAPVHQLLGGRCRDRIALYANCWSNVVRSPDELASFATVQVERGFRAVKIYPFLYNVGTAMASPVSGLCERPSGQMWMSLLICSKTCRARRPTLFSMRSVPMV